MVNDWHALRKSSHANYRLREAFLDIVQRPTIEMHVLNEAAGMVRLGVEAGWRSIDPFHFLPGGVIRKPLDNFKPYLIVTEHNHRTGSCKGVNFAVEDNNVTKFFEINLNGNGHAYYERGFQIGRGQAWRAQNILEAKGLYIPNAEGVLGVFFNGDNQEFEPCVFYVDTVNRERLVQMKSRLYFAAANFKDAK